MKRLCILGSTGSIGQSALSLVDMFPDRFQVASLAANARKDLLCEQALKYKPEVVALFDRTAVEALRERLPGVRVVAGREGVIEAAVHEGGDSVVAGISGAAGLEPTFSAILARKHVALANKETLVMAGELVMATVKSLGTSLLPVDSEHCALHQCLRGCDLSQVNRLLLTASGGPFFRFTREQLATVTAEQALNHPTWRMGRKITIDSATLMNKGLEVIEAHHLFGVSPDRITVVIHPQSTIHSMVEFIDATVLAQMSIPDMRSAILYALTYPERWRSALPRLDFDRLSPLEFYPPDRDLFPCLGLAYAALEQGRTYAAALNAANEVAVEAFLEGRINLVAIPRLIEQVLERHEPLPADRLESVLEADRRARQTAREALTRLSSVK
jgi:1-deoxy-D-xylulose-5-phosphate reductoisomerase